MSTLHVADATLNYLVRHDGEPVLLIHGALVADAFEPMVQAADAIDRIKLITYDRRGFGDSSQPDQPRTISEEAVDAVAVLDEVAVARAHIVGHSLAGLIALQIAIDNPERVRSLTLLEPALLSMPSGAGFAAGVEPSTKLYDEGDLPGALTAFLTLVGGTDAMDRLGHLSPDALAQAQADLGTLFSSDLNALSTFELDEKAIEAIEMPTLIIRGTESPAVFQEAADYLDRKIPNTTTTTLTGSSHFLQMEQPEAAGRALIDFVTAHPLRPSGN